MPKALGVIGVLITPRHWGKILFLVLKDGHVDADDQSKITLLCRSSGGLVSSGIAHCQL